jgi:hypothetical protein
VETPAGPASPVEGAVGPSASDDGARRFKILRALSMGEWVVAGLITLLALHLHFVFWRHAGALWRDEVSSIDLANLPGVVPLWTMLTHDSFPLLWSLVLRFWETIGLGGTDLHLRWLGLLIGAILLASIWIAGLINRRPPLIALSLFSVSAITIRSGDSLRAYGLGTALIILTVAFLWRFYRKPTTGHWLLAAAFAILSVQSLYQNAFLLLAAGLSASSLAAIQKKWRTAFWIIALGLIAAISLLPYFPQIARSQDWWMIEKAGLDQKQLWLKASEALDSPRPWFNLVWVALTLLAVAIGGIQLFRVGRKNLDLREIMSFAALSLVLGLAGFVFFLTVARLQTQPWYYLPIMGFVVLCLDFVLANTNWVRPFLVAFAVVTTGLSFRTAPAILQNRQTNLDMLADQLSSEAQPNDFIVVNNWYYGVTFQRYYHGVTPWMTLPPLSDLSLHRYDLLKAEMQNPDALRPLLEQVSAALRDGHRVWLVGRIPLDGHPPPAIQPAPNNSWGWHLFPYTQVWAAELGYFLTLHATGAQRFPITSGINSFENVEIASVSGWHE